MNQFETAISLHEVLNMKLKMVLMALAVLLSSPFASATNLSWTGSTLEAGKNQSPIDSRACPAVVTEVAINYLTLADVGFTNFDKSRHTLELIEWRNLTPGTWDQRYIAVFKMMDHKSGQPVPVQQIVLKLSGDFNCDNLRVISARVKPDVTAGGIERGD
jgi:hypothetical protein